jgi:ADP-ribose pyrophosphatase YjhB (NUDIX family)
MKIIKVIHDTDIGSNTAAPGKYKERRAARALVFDQAHNVALLHATKKDYHKLPGGGIEEGEDIAEALKRECLEEIGCNIGNIKELGVIEEYRNDFMMHQLSYCYVADLVGEPGQNCLEEGEAADGFEPVWMSLEDAIKTLEGEAGIEHYEGKFIRLRDLSFLQAAR